MTKVFPISFSIPESKIIDSVKEKTKPMATIIPGDTSTYIFTDEKDYYEDYQKSMFGKTTKKAGWDCMRHYEILANGCIPYFENLNMCPPNTMTHFPKELVNEAMKDFGNYEKCIEHCKRLLQYTKENLTTKAMATYILNKINRPDAKSILYLSEWIGGDYMRDLCLHGFKTLFGPNCHEYPKSAHCHIYSDYKEPGKLYGKGFSYSCLLDPCMRNNLRDDTLYMDIKNHKYDLVIFGSIHRGVSLYNYVKQYYKSEDVVFICGEDLHQCSLSKGFDNHPIFIREL